MYIDLTESPPPSPKVKPEAEDSTIKREPERRRGEQNVKRELASEGSIRGAETVQSNGLPADNSEDTPTSRVECDKKRKAVEDELKEVELSYQKVELEYQKVTLEQKKLRLTKALAEMKDKGKWGPSDQMVCSGRAELEHDTICLGKKKQIFVL